MGRQFRKEVLMSTSTIIRKAAPIAASAVALALMFAVTGPVMAKDVLKSGQFMGQSDHVTTGSVTIEKDGDRIFVVLGPKFSLDGAPEPTLGFSNNGKFDVKTEFTKLKSNTGRQVYEVPKGIVVSAYDAFTVWCSKFSVPLGSARLN